VGSKGLLIFAQRDRRLTRRVNDVEEEI
jgi:hypothetical protein